MPNGRVGHAHSGRRTKEMPNECGLNKGVCDGPTLTDACGLNKGGVRMDPG